MYRIAFLNGFLKDHTIEGILITGYVILFIRTKVLLELNINRIQAMKQRSTKLLCKNNDENSNLANIFPLHMPHIDNLATDV